METTPVIEKRQLRQRKAPVAPAEPEFESDEEVRGQRKRRKTTSRSVKNKNNLSEPEQESIHANGDDEATQGNDLGSQPNKGRKRKAGSTQRKRNMAKAPQVKGKSVAAGGKKKKKSRSVVRGDTGDANLEEEEGGLQDEQEEALQQEEEEAMEPTKRVAKLRKTEASDAEFEAELVGDPFDDAEARKRWPHRYQGKVYI